jgi:DNA polymerase I-like protein with 3'-5' exonuclease and polymerase domains
VHDELIYEMPEGAWQEYAKQIKSVMESVLPSELSHGVPIVAEIKSGNDWANLKDIKS